MEKRLPPVTLPRSTESSRSSTPKNSFQIRNELLRDSMMSLDHPALRTPQPQRSPRPEQPQRFEHYRQPGGYQRLEHPRSFDPSRPNSQPLPYRLQPIHSPQQPSPILRSVFDSDDVSPPSSPFSSFSGEGQKEKDPLTAAGKRRSRHHRRDRSLTVLIFETTIFVLAVTTLGLASAYGVQLVHAPLASDHPLEALFSGVHTENSTRDVDVDAAGTRSRLLRRIADGLVWTPPSRNTSQRAEAENWSVFYNGTMPFLSVLFAIIGISLWARGRATPVYSAVVGAVMLVGWSVNIGWWVACDWSFVVPPFKGPKTCYQSKLIITPTGLVGMDTALMNAKISFGILMLAAYAAYLSAIVFFPVKNSPFARLWKIR